MFKKDDKIICTEDNSWVKKGCIGTYIRPSNSKDSSCILWESNGYGTNEIELHVGNKYLELLEEPKSKEVVPEYVECVGAYGDCVKGTVYCTANEIEENGMTWQEILICCGNLGSYFIPSTKEVFDLQNTPKEEKPEVLVFGKFKIGSIVVSLETAYPYRKPGDMFKVLPNSSKEFLYYLAETHNPCKDDWRQATDSEVKAFEQGITNINDIKTEENLVGRYIKALKDSPQSTGIKKDAFIKIIRENTNHYIIENNCSINKIRLNIDWELMPIGFTPNEVKEDYSFYVEYEPDFTEDIFNKFKDWTLSKGKIWNSYCNGNLEDFKYGGYLFYDTYHAGASNHEWGAKKQLSLSELCTLIGYKQEVKEESINTNTIELTGDWCIKITSENQRLVGEWFKEKGYDTAHCYSIGAYYGEKNKKGDSNSFNSFGKELTLDEFKKLVLKESTSSEEFKVGDWVTIIEDSKGNHTDKVVGESFKIAEVSDQGGNCIYLRHSLGKTSGILQQYVRKSTPEEIAKAQGYKVSETILNIEVPKSTKKTVVRINNEQEFIKVVNYTGKKMYKYSEIDYDVPCISLSDGCYSSEEWYLENGYNVIYFDEFQRDYLKEYIPGQRVPYPELQKEYLVVPEDCITFVEPKKKEYPFNEQEYLSKPFNQKLELNLKVKTNKKSKITI